MASHGVPFFFTQCKSLVPSPVYAIQVNSGGFFANFLTSLTDDVTSEIAADTVMSNNATVCDLYHPNRIITWLSLVPFYHLKNFISHVNFKLRHSVQIFTVCVNGLIYFTQEIHNCFLEILSSDEYSKKREFLETQNVILASGDSLLVSRNSIHSSFDSRVETVNLLLSGTEILHSQGHNVRSDLKVNNHYKV